MPTYDYRCAKCGDTAELFRTISDYVANPLPLFHCGIPMERLITVTPGRAIDHPCGSDRIYDGLKTLDGVDVSTKAKHRAYMKERGLTTADDYRGEWTRAAAQRAESLAGNDPSRREDISKALDKLNR